MINKLKYWFASLGVAIIIGGAIGWYMYQKPVKNFAESSSDYSLPATTIFAEFALNPEAATQKYVADDKVVQISGILKEKNQNEDGTVTFILDSGTLDGSVACTFTKENSARALQKEIGSEVILKGQCTGFEDLINPELILIRCGLVN